MALGVTDRWIHDLLLLGGGPPSPGGPVFRSPNPACAAAGGDTSGKWRRRLRNFGGKRTWQDLRTGLRLRRSGLAQTRPRRTATAAASDRALTPSLAKRLATWVCTVRDPMKSAS